MSAKEADSAEVSGGNRRGGVVMPGRIAVAVIVVLALVFIFENTRHTKIRLLIPEVIMPLWPALLGMGVIGAVCGAYFTKRRR
ncbi:DUF1049 domain-containing protein [Streptomyces sp. NPDC002845]